MAEALTARELAAQGDNRFNFTIPLTALLGGVLGLLGGRAADLGPWVGILAGAVIGAALAFILTTYLPRRTGPWRLVSYLRRTQGASARWRGCSGIVHRRRRPIGR